MSNRPAAPLLITTTSSRRITWITGLATLALVLASFALVVPNAHAAAVIAFTPTGGTVGITIPLRATITDASAALKAGSLSYYATPGTLIGTAPVTDAGVSEPVAWIPAKAGSTALYAVFATTDGTQTVTSSATTVVIAKASTTTVVTAPAMAKVSSAVDFTATVKTGGAYVPTGTVTFQKGDGTPIETKALNAAGAASVSILMPATAQTYSVRAVYLPDASTLGSESATTSTTVTASGSNLALSAPTTGTPGTAIAISVTASPSTSSGTVTFYVGSTVIDVRPLVSGAATTAWTPTTTGSFTIKANYSSTGVSVDGSAAQVVTIGQPTPTGQTDRITLLPSNSGAAWVPNAGYVLRNQGSVTLNTRSTSGLPVSLAVTGSCTVSGTTVTARAGSGTCALTASTSGSAAYLPATQRNTIALAAGVQTIAPKAPAPGRVAFGRWYRLADPGLLTNTGAPVSWYVTSGTSRCKVASTVLGAVVFKFKRHGSCTIAARAPGIPQTWLSLNRYYGYRA